MAENPSNLGPIVPVLAQRGKFTPEVGRQMPVHLLGEIVMTRVLEVTSPDVLVVEITGMVMGKTGHGLRTKDHIAVQRTIGELETEIWAPVSEREVTMRETAARLAHAEADRRQAEAAAMAPRPIAEILPPKPKKPVRKPISKARAALHATAKRKGAP
jgi:hypothetical protein